ncbi:MAG: glyoxylase I family protein [Planctomycetota bacterium]|jgi:glyoxylase I family protein
MKITAFHHVCIQTEHYRESLDFYVQGLGFEIVHESAGFHTRDFNTWLRGGGMMIELQTPKAGTNFRPWSKNNAGPVHICFVVENVEDAYQELKNAGFHDFKNKNGQEIYEILGSKLFKVCAPEGTEIEIRDTAEL